MHSHSLDGLKAYFEQFGAVADCNIMRDPTGRSRCFGFVTFVDPVVVDIVLQKTHILDKKQVCHRFSLVINIMQIDPKRAIPKEQQHPPPQSSVSSSGARSSLAKEENKVFVGGIHIEADESDLKQVFEEFGEVLETILMRDRDTGRSRGFGFVTFATHDGALKSCEDADIHIRGRRVHYLKCPVS